MYGFQRMFQWIDCNAVQTSKLSFAFHPNRVLKVLGMALNIKVSNYFDYFKNWLDKFTKYSGNSAREI